MSPRGMFIFLAFIKLAQIAITASDRRLKTKAEYARMSEPDADDTEIAPYIPKVMGRISKSILSQRNLLRIKNRAKKTATDATKVGRDTEFAKLGTLSKAIREKKEDREREQSHALISERANSGRDSLKDLYSFFI